MTKLSVNINKIAVVRNSRGGNLPDVVRAALDCERFGAQGNTDYMKSIENGMGTWLAVFDHNGELAGSISRVIRSLRSANWYSKCVRRK